MNPANDIRSLRRRLEELGGGSYWRSLEELAGTDEFTFHVRSEFPEGASEWTDEPGRRRFLKLMGASLALAGIQGCVSGPPQEKIVPYVDDPEHVVPGRPDFYATTFAFRGYGQGVLVESHTGRPTKIEGNPDHPASLGSTSAFAQASVLGLYDPYRSTTPRLRGETATVEQFASALDERMRRFRANGGEGLRILTQTVLSPTLGAQLETLLNGFPQAQWHVHDPLRTDNGEEGLRRVFGRPMKPVYRIANADVILSVDSDFLYALPGSVRYAREFAARRRVLEGQTAMNRLYAVESTVAVTGSMADHRLPLPPSRVHHFMRALASYFGVADAEAAISERDRGWLQHMADDLVESSGLVMAGETLPPELHALAHGINDRLGYVGQTVEYIEPPEARPPRGPATLAALTDDVKAGRVDTLVILGGNPVYTAPADVDFPDALLNVPTSVHLGIHRDETSRRCIWHVPALHYLEEWGDLRAFDGTASIVQPLIRPLYDACRSPQDVLAMMLGSPGTGSYELVRSYWRGRLPGDFETAWTDVLRRGAILGTGRLSTDAERIFGAPGATEGDLRLGMSTVQPDTAGARPDATRAQSDTAMARPDTPTVRPDTAMARPDTVVTAMGQPDTTVAPAGAAAASGAQPDESAGTPLELVFRPDPNIWDGSYATNFWLQELPKPLTKLVWGNAILIPPDLAERRRLENQQVVEVSFQGRTLTGPVWIVPGHPPETATVFLGYGRSHVAPEIDGLGYDAFRIRTSEARWHGSAELRKSEESRQLVSTQHHHSMEGRPIVEEAEIARFRDNPDFIHEDEMHELPSLYPEYEYPENKWGMVVDLNVCIGCNACVVACQAENNIPVVGREEVRRGREMHWLRVDRYYKGPLKNPEAYFQPVPCMHCEKAPCELVCPTYATVHDSEGLNVMVYNRCIGTRYCSNNCPYKVRRFNFLDYTAWAGDARSLQKNPDVTVRSRGVMEKCTYCVQRISAARIRAKTEGRPIHDGEVRTACQMACPTEAITFGDLAREGSAVQRLEKQPHNYKLLHHLGTRPRTSYLAHFRNPNERMPEPEGVEFRIGQEEKLEVEVGQPR